MRRDYREMGEKKGGCVGEELERKGGGDGCPRKDRHYLHYSDLIYNATTFTHLLCRDV